MWWNIIKDQNSKKLEYLKLKINQISYFMQFSIYDKFSHFDNKIV
jgi:hypothetical protein